ncbi:MAG: pirin family protein [Marinobacter sp.]|nr:pirin family protein [Marinobacter sp.]
MIKVRAGNDRGHAKHGWLDSRHSFSFAEYYDPAFMGFSDLRVINDDWVDPGAGFGTHPHQDMEIITYVLEGTVEHRDTMNTHSRVIAGEVQIMSAGSGVRHSEYNASSTEPLNFLQIWIIPNQRDAEPRYGQKDFSDRAGITLMISPDGEEGSLPIRQDTRVYKILINSEALPFKPAPKRIYYVQIARGELSLNGTALTAGDGAYIVEEESLTFSADQQAEALLFELRSF